ncbi:MAG: hypothetical protein P4L96_17165 [Rhodoferax sp.]|nr:hypothetical protein [Rhodoferax sp.]
MIHIMLHVTRISGNDTVMYITFMRLHLAIVVGVRVAKPQCRHSPSADA